MNFHEDIIGLYLWLIFRDVVRSYGNNDGDLGPIWIHMLKISTSKGCLLGLFLCGPTE